MPISRVSFRPEAVIELGRGARPVLPQTGPLLILVAQVRDLR